MPRVARIGLGVLLGLLVWSFVQAKSGESVQAAQWTKRYDDHFRKYSKHYFGAHFDWRWFKAQAIAESGLRSDVTSVAGARGIMQILPSTYDEIRAENPHFIDIGSPRWNIAAGIFYDRKLYRRWREDAHAADRLYFTFASYNAGLQRVRRAAQRIEESPKPWHQVRRYTPGQTRHYVRRIRRLMQSPVTRLPVDPAPTDLRRGMRPPST